MKRYVETGVGRLRDAPRAGCRQEVAQARMAKLAHGLYVKNMPTLKKLLRLVRDRLNVTCSPESARRIRRSPGF